jgi:hypothetical protein
VSTAALALSVLQKTRERLQNPNDWNKGAAKGHNGAVCLVEALCEQMTDSDFSVSRVGAAAQALRNVMPSGNSDGLARYNDKPGITHENILELIDNAIKECDRLLDPV